MNNLTTPLASLKVTSFVTSAHLSWSSTFPSLFYGINCTTTSKLSEDVTVDEEPFLSRSQCIYYTVDNSTNSLLVTGLSQATSYTCCLQDHSCSVLACEDVTTIDGQMGESQGRGGGLTGAAAGVLGGAIGVILVLAVFFTVAGIILSIMYYRKRQQNRSVSHRQPINRKQSQRYSTRSNKDSTLGRKTSMKPPHHPATRAESLHTAIPQKGLERDTDNDDTGNPVSDDEPLPEPSLSQEEREEALYASTSIPPNALRQILQATENPLVSLTESCEEPDQYEPMLALKPSGPIYGNVSKAKEPLVPDYVNYPKRS